MGITAESVKMEVIAIRIIMETNKGTIKIELWADKAPISVENFLRYTDNSFFDGLVFHRVIPGFMIQGGGFTEDMQQKPTRDTIQNEAGNGLSNKAGTIAMARTPDPHSASAQFFINVADNHFLDKERSQDGWGYAVFGAVSDGMDVVEKIRNVATGNSGFHQDVPVEPVLIESAELIED